MDQMVTLGKVRQRVWTFGTQNKNQVNPLLALNSKCLLAKIFLVQEMFFRAAQTNFFTQSKILPRIKANNEKKSKF